VVDFELFILIFRMTFLMNKMVMACASGIRPVQIQANAGKKDHSATALGLSE
jgi:hypothetical protein